MRLAYICATDNNSKDPLFSHLAELVELDKVIASHQIDLQPYDGYLYQTELGWSKPFYEMMLTQPGIVILHNYVLSSFLHQIHNATQFAEDLRYCYGRLGEVLLEQNIDISQIPDNYPMFEALVDASLGIIVHSQQAHQRLLHSRPLANINKINYPISIPSPNTLTLSKKFTIGVINATNELSAQSNNILQLLQAYQQQNPCQIVVSSHPQVHALLRELLVMYGLEKQTLQVIAKAGASVLPKIDLALILDIPKNGQMPRSVLELMGHGVPVILPDVETVSELPNDACVKIELDDFFEAMLAELLQRLQNDDLLRRQIGQNAYDYVQKHHAPRSIADQCLEFIQQTLTQTNQPLGLIPLPQDDVLQLLTEIATDLADLGLTENDIDLVQPIADTFVELGLSLNL